MSRRTNIAKASEVVLAALDKCDFGDDELRVVIEVVDPANDVVKSDDVISKALERETPVFKTQEERYVLGVVLEPLKEMGGKDSQHDTYSAEEVKQASYRFMEDFGTLGHQHKVAVNGRVKLLENWIVREDTTIEGLAVKAGTWLMGIRVVDDDLWKGVKTGAITGFSIGGYARRTPVPPS
jgi:DNA adenine methylase